MKLSDFNYTLPKELIAQYPSERRGDDRLLVIDRKKLSFEEKNFSDIYDFFKKDDLLVLNDTKVIPARLFGKRKTGGKVEIFIIDMSKHPVEALVRSSGRIKEGEEVILESGDRAKICGKSKIGRLVEFNKPVSEILSSCGHVPLPPYISRADESSDLDRYQTIYAAKEGATASPTAGLHFTKDIIDKLKEKGVKTAFVTLHVSYGTFAPIKEDDLEKHVMHTEYYRISKENIAIINEARNRKSNIFACGTTTLRVLETCADNIVNFIPQAYSYGGMQFNGFEGFTNLFIYPGYRFRITNKLITNFHLPKSTLLLLTSAFADKDLIFKAYDYAIGQEFKFFSYGDAMLIL
ncbi:MAG: tRNA preQ1(34) S-adenosylmethionine ribosyltransferase-isomerase QueA [Candidatus Omnitrophica bacterium]|nr:tRNA preQ1(34) S-adenosylmethionine ribosyltransferase-isomerase QueA [Candidatus Omnitrophota bacterium]